MKFHTIDQNYDYQMAQAVAQLLSDYGMTPDNFTPEELMDFLYKFRAEFGEIVVNKMAEFTDEEDWMEAVKSA